MTKWSHDTFYDVRSLENALPYNQNLIIYFQRSAYLFKLERVSNDETNIINDHDIVYKSFNWQDADQLVILHGDDEKLNSWLLRKNSANDRAEALNTRPSDYKTSPLNHSVTLLYTVL